MASQNLKPYINQSILERTKLITFLDGSVKKTGYQAELLPKMCDVYLQARRDKALIPSQIKLAIQSEILLSAFSQVGIIALIDEASGYQYSGERKHDALRILLSKYVAEELQNRSIYITSLFVLYKRQNQRQKIIKNIKTI